VLNDRQFLEEQDVRKNVHAVFPVPLTENLLNELNTLKGQDLKDLKADMSEALKNRVRVFLLKENIRD
jgi:uncharacterized protein YbcI